MPAFELHMWLAKQGVPNALKLDTAGNITITAIRSEKVYHSIEACLKGELGKEETHEDVPAN